MMTNKAIDIMNYLNELYPDAKGELIFHNDIELLVAVVLSAQATDKSVNNVTPYLFNKYPTVYDLAEAKVEDVEEVIKSIGLYKAKARNIVGLAKEIVKKYDGHVPNNKEDLILLPGVGNKTAGVVRLELFHYDEFPVDTHVSRISKRLGLAKSSDEPSEIEHKLKKIFPKECWSHLHHQFIFFGRYFCLAKKPNCHNCKIKNYCKNN